MKTIIVEQININGEGTSFLDGKKYCVKNVLPGEKVEVEEFFLKKNFVNSRLKNIIQPSPKRIVPICPYFEKCGGCDCMFLSQKDAKDLKKEILQDYFKEVFPKTSNYFMGQFNFFYRNKVAFAVENGKVGLREYKSKKIIEVDKCFTAKKEINIVLNLFRKYLENKKFNPKSETNNVSHLVVRVLQNQISIVIVCKKRENDIDNFISLLSENFGENFGLFYNFNKNKNEIFSDEWQYICGKRELVSYYKDIKFYVKPYSFLQVNDEIMNTLYDEVLKSISGEIVVEGYSGAGILSCAISKSAKNVIAIEINSQATESANKTKFENEIENLTNINGDCNEILPKKLLENSNATLLLDPPRSGCSIEVLNIIKQVKPKKIVYISCNPYTLRQNINYLKDCYKVEKLDFFEMFPQTFNVETLAILTKK